jgi:MFS superfamily sulfate permease-like transporter
LFSAMMIPVVLNMIPLASLAAILFLVGYKLAKPALFKQMYKMGWSQFIPFMVTILGIVFTDLLMGIAMGMAVAIFYILRNNYKKPYFFDPEKHVEGEPIRIALAEDVTFLNKADILQTLNHLPSNSTVIIDASQTINIDEDVREIILDFKKTAELRNIDLTIVSRKQKGMPASPVKLLQEVVVNGNGMDNGTVTSEKSDEFPAKN